MEILFRIEMLGRFAVWQGNREITRFRTQKTASLLAYLALYPHRPHPREALIQHFWPDSPLELARASLRVALNTLRRQLEPPGVPAGAVLIADHRQVRLNPLAFTSDVEDFESLLQEAQATTQPQNRLECGKAAVALYLGSLLPGHYEEWVLPERDRLQEAFCGALRQLIKENVEAKNFDPALLYTHRLVQVDPLREESYRQLMRLYAVLGRTDEALVHYQALERLLQKELQATPSSATRDLAEQLRQVAPPSGKTEKGHAAAIQTKQASAAEPAARTDSKPPALKVPLQFTRFFGREEAIAQIVETLSAKPNTGGESDPMLAASRSRLVSLTGPGGTGKTRLSVEAARRMKETFSGGIWFVALAELQDPLLIGGAIQEALELPPDTRVPALEQVIAYLDLQPPCLLLLDNFEQIAAGGAPVVWTLLQRAPSLHCLVTSRLPLSLPGEREIPVQPLPIPALEAPAPASSLLTTHLLTYPSVALFVDRAQAACSYFQITVGNALQIAAICQKIEGIPLAIELAAARVKTLTPSQILERLSERFDLLSFPKSNKTERHRSLWAAIDWSYHLLAPDLQHFFARLSVFRGGWTLEAAEAVCEEPLALDYLSQLRAHSLIRAEESAAAIHFRMLETLREFAEEKLKPEWAAGLKERHRDYFLALAETAEEAFISTKQAHWLQHLEQEHDNMRASLQHCLEKNDGDVINGLRLIAGLRRFWHHRGHWSEGRAWCERVLAQRGAQKRSKWRARALYAAAYLNADQGDDAAAQARYEEALEISREIGDRQGIAGALSGLGRLAQNRGDMEQAQALFTQSLLLRRELGDTSGVAASLLCLGGIRAGQGAWEEVQSLYKEALALYREVGDRAGEARCCNHLGSLILELGRFEEARSLHEQALILHRDLEDKEGIAASLVNLGNAATNLQDVAAARAYYEESLSLNRELGNRHGVAIVLANLGPFVCDQGDYAAARNYLVECLQLCQEIGTKYIVVAALEGMAALVRAQGWPERAARFVAAAGALREALSYSRPPLEQEKQDRVLEALRSALGEDDFMVAWTEGVAMTLDQAIAAALAVETASNNDALRAPETPVRRTRG